MKQDSGCVSWLPWRGFDRYISFGHSHFVGALPQISLSSPYFCQCISVGRIICSISFSFCIFFAFTTHPTKSSPTPHIPHNNHSHNTSPSYPIPSHSTHSYSINPHLTHPHASLPPTYHTYICHTHPTPLHPPPPHPPLLQLHIT